MVDSVEWDVVTGVPPKEVVAEQVECAHVKSLILTLQSQLSSVVERVTCTRLEIGE